MGENRLLGLGIGVAVLAVLTLLPALIVPVFYLFANVYAIVIGTDFGLDTMNVGVFATGLVMTVALLLLLLAGAVALIGRGLSPKRTRED
jgi:Na+/H+ antiporter NhaC